MSEPAPTSNELSESGSNQPCILPSRKPLFWLAGGFFLFLSLLVAGSYAWLTTQPAPPSVELEAPIQSSSPFKNTSKDAQYVGSASCLTCHKNRTESFRSTGMGQSMASVDPAREPPDAVCDHPVSKRRYQVTRKEGMLWHRELLLNNDDEEVVLSEYPLKYAIGSGRHGRTYVAEAEGFLVESPLTWYASRNVWDMSPGYDHANHQGFQRAIGEGCLTCHAGHADAIEQSVNRIVVTEAAISCERCHGPGSLHVQFRTRRKEGVDEPIDYTIVNPAHLPRELAEAVCQQCHLNVTAAILGRGRKLSDFRPGLPLQEYRQDYQMEVGNQPMSVVGHVDQMHLSRCYTQTQTLTCTTCHNPHAFPAPDKRAAYYQAKCLQCHAQKPCTVNPERQQRENPANNCVQCHMPSAPTDVPHVAFTHHRIAIHEKLPKQLPEQNTKAAVLQPLLEFPSLSELDKKRSLGLVYLNLAKLEPKSDIAATYRNRALGHLFAVHEAGLPDPVVDATLSRVLFERGDPQALTLAEKALAHPDLTGAERCTALFVMAGVHLKNNRYPQAKAALHELTTLRRFADDWLVLAECEKALGNRAGVVAALRSAVRINPRLTSAHQFLANHYRATGDVERTAWHQKRASQ
jgi:tetratricopeptide (TPR) repeat protein